MHIPKLRIAYYGIYARLFAVYLLELFCFSLKDEGKMIHSFAVLVQNFSFTGNLAFKTCKK